MPKPSSTPEEIPAPDTDPTSPKQSASPGGAQFRLSSILDKLKQKEGSFAALARAITRAYRESGATHPAHGDVIDRRKLKSLVEQGKGAVLTMDDLFALEPYLSQFGESLALRPILQKPDLMDALATCGRLTFLLGSRPETERRMVSEYDVLGVGEIQRAIGHAQSSVRQEVKTVPMAKDRSPRDQVRDFIPLLHDDNGPSLCCLASSRSNPFTELLLCEIFGYPAFGEGPLPEDAQPPFRLVWNPTLPDLYDSHFCADIKALRERDPAAAAEVAAGKASALLTRDDVFVDRVTPRGWGDTYGVCVAQRRRRGQVWLLLLGITGAATFVSAKVANRLATRLGEAPGGQDSNIYWGIVRAHVHESQKHQFFDLRQFAQEEIFTQTTVPAPQRASGAAR